MMSPCKLVGQGIWQGLLWIYCPHSLAPLSSGAGLLSRSVMLLECLVGGVFFYEDNDKKEDSGSLDLTW